MLQPPAAPLRLRPAFVPALPGLAVAMGLAAAAVALHELPGCGAVSPAMLALPLGLVARQGLGASPALRPGLALAVRGLLRLAVMLLGLQVTLGQVAALGFGALGGLAAGLAGCFLGTLWLGRRLGVAPRLTRLIAAGTSVCGASAIAAANSVVQGDEDDVAYAMATVTLFGTLAMLGLPAVALALGLDPRLAGLWLGGAIHEVAQVVGAASQLGADATAAATVAKMARVLMLAPLVLGLAAASRRQGETGAAARLPVPWFVFGFLALAALASTGLLPAGLTRGAGLLSQILLAAALGAMGFALDLRALRRKGWRPLALAAAASLLIAGLCLGLMLAVA